MLSGNSRKVWITIICVLYVLINIGIATFGFVSKHKKEMAFQLEDRNGDSKELCIITDEMIEQYSVDYHAIARRSSTKGETSGVKGHFKDRDYSYIRTRIRSLTGVYVCNAYLGTGTEVTYSISSKVDRGNLKIVITDEDNIILFDVPIDSDENISFIAEDSKLYYVKFVGESAKLDIEVSRND